MNARVSRGQGALVTVQMGCHQIFLFTTSACSLNADTRWTPPAGASRCSNFDICENECDCRDFYRFARGGSVHLRRTSLDLHGIYLAVVPMSLGFPGSCRSSAILVLTSWVLRLACLGSQYPVQPTVQASRSASRILLLCVYHQFK